MWVVTRLFTFVWFYVNAWEGTQYTQRYSISMVYLLEGSLLSDVKNFLLTILEINIKHVLIFRIKSLLRGNF